MARSVYPRENASLLPKALSPLIGTRRVPRHLILKYGFTADLNLSSLDRSVWKTLSRDAIQALSAVVIRETTDAWPKIKSSTSLVSVDTSGEHLSRRAKNGLQRSGLLGNAHVKQARLGELAMLPQVGAKTLLEWLVSWEPFESADPEPSPSSHRHPSPAVQREARDLQTKPWAHLVRRDDPRLGVAVATIAPVGTTAWEIAESAAGRPMDSVDAQVMAAALRRLIDEAERLQGQAVDVELMQLIDSTFAGSPDGRVALLLRTGFGGQAPTTLEAAGAAVGLSRERVRQIERYVLKRLNEGSAWTPALDRTLSCVVDLLPASAEAVQAELVQQGLCDSGFSIASVLHAAEVLGKEQRVSYDDVSTSLYEGTADVSVKVVGSAARKLTEHWGAATVDAVSEELSETVGRELSVEHVRSHLALVPSLEWLDEKRDWFWVKDVSRNRVLNAVEKMVAVAGSLPVSELREGVGRWYRMGGFRPPRDVLARLCVASGSYEVHGELIVETPAVPAWEDILGSIERTMVEVLFEKGPIMRRDELEAEVVARGINRNSFYVYLSYSPLFARYAPGVFGLRGARVSAAEVKALIPPRTRHQRLLDHGWTPDGQIWIGYRLSAAAVQTGVLTVPAALKGLVSGDYSLRAEKTGISGKRGGPAAEKGTLVGTLVAKEGRMWGLTPFFHRWGVEAGDFLVVRVDASSRSVTVVAGGEEILARHQGAE